MVVVYDQKRSANTKKTLLDELNLLREAANAIQLRHFEKNSSMLYIPKCIQIIVMKT